MFTRIPGNLFEDSGNVNILRSRGMLKKIPWDVEEDYGESSRRFGEMFKKIPGNVRKDSGNVQKDSWECSRRFPGMLEKISVNAREHSGESNFRFICEILLIFFIKFCY